MIATMMLAVMMGAANASEWPVLKTYDGEYLRRVKMPMGGIGTGTISLSGRGSLVDWEIENRPAKGHTPSTLLKSPHFAIRYATKSGAKAARILEGPLYLDEYEGDVGCHAPNHGFPRFARAVFKAAYPLAQLELSDPKFALAPRLEAFNPLVPGDADASGIPAIWFRWNVTNPTAEPLDVSIVGTVPLASNLYLTAIAKADELSVADDLRDPGWGVVADRYWRRLLNEGTVANTPADDTTAIHPANAYQLCVRFSLEPGATRSVPFVLAWRNSNRKAWTNYDSTDPEDVVGNYYATRYPTAKAAADDLIARQPELEAKTIGFVRGILAGKAPDVVKEAALFNVSTLRSETCFRTADGHFFGWEGCYDRKGSCMGSCTHVWGYEHCLIDLWPDLARDMLELQFGPALDPKTGFMAFRIGLPLKYALARGIHNAAADGQMQCIIKAYEYWKRFGDDAWMRRLYPAIRKALEFCWIEHGWDGDVDGVMEGCQHNTMDVEYYGPNPQMEFLYLAALRACVAMAERTGDAEFASKCRGLAQRGSQWTEANLFNGSYYEHRIVPPKSAEAVAKGLRHKSMGAKDLSNPDYQLGAGCLVDQLLGDFSARSAGIGRVVDAEHERITLQTILEKCRRAPDDDQFNTMRSFVLPGETSLRMAWYPQDRLPRSPFPYYPETMTGFEYVVAGLLAMNGDYAAAEKVVRDIRERYDGRKRNPFDEAECGHHYARAMAAWTVMKQWK